MNAEPLLSWQSCEIDGYQRMRGFLSGQPGHTLFIIKPIGLSGQHVHLLGAFISDQQERQKVYGLEGAKCAAEEILRDWVCMAAELIQPSRKALANVGTLAASALRTVIADADTQAAMDVEAGVLHAGTARAVFGIIRDVVRPFNTELADALVSPKTEKARVRE
jgi:hypothetical protein